METYWVYILASKRNGTLYIGFTSDLDRRIFEHKFKLVEGFTKRYNINKLVYYEEYTCRNDAFIRERQMKKWNRAWKIELIEKENPNWKDFAEDWFDEDDFIFKL